MSRGRVLVTGASGLIGRHTVDLLEREGYGVRTFHRGDPLPRAEHVRGDVADDVAHLCQAARGCHTIVHLAGRGDVAESRRDPLGYARLNATGALHALEAARAAGAHLLLASSQRIYPLRPEPCREDDPPRPDSPYGYAKWVAELWCRMQSEQFGAPTTVLRFFSVYGPGQQANGLSGVVSIFVQAALEGRPLVVRSAGQRDFTDARDAARGILLALQRPTSRQPHRVYNVATGEGTRFAELARLVVALAESPSVVQEELDEPAGRDLVADVGRARTELGYVPTIGLRDGLERCLTSIRERVAA